MRVTFDTNAGDVSKAFRRLFADQIPYARSVALNRTADRAQEAQRKHQRRAFHVRRPTFVDRAVKIRRGDRASKRRREVIVRIEPPGGEERADILTQHEERHRKRPRSGERLAIPVAARRTGAGVVSKSERLASLQLRRVSRDVSVGPRGVMAVARPGGRGFVLKRTGRGRSTRTRLLYVFQPSVPLAGVLDFVDNVSAAARRWFPVEWPRAFDHALRTRK